MVASSNANHNLEPWLIDSVATNHYTSNLNNLSFPKPYSGQERIIVGNGQGLPILTQVMQNYPILIFFLNLEMFLEFLKLHLIQPLFINFVMINNCWCYFDENQLFIQAFLMRKVLYQGKSERGVYPIYPLLSTHLKLPHKTFAFFAIT